MSTQNVLPPLPRPIWWPWDEPAERVGFYRPFYVPEPARATLYLSAGGPFCRWLDDRWLELADHPLPPWRLMRRLEVELAPGPHALNVLAASDDHGQPLLLACLDCDLAAGMTTLWETFDPSWLGHDPHGTSIVAGQGTPHAGALSAFF